MVIRDDILYRAKFIQSSYTYRIYGLCCKFVN